MKVLITGGSGFLGSHITDFLLKRGDSVVVIDNFETGRRDNLKPHINLSVVEGTIANEELLDSLFTKHSVEFVIHAAAAYKNPENWIEDAKSNIIGTINVVKCCLKHNVKRIVYFQTALCYGTKPIEQPITLNHPILPEGSSYSISKTTAEQYIHLSGLDYVTFRLANVYGPRNISGPLPVFYSRLTSNKPCFVMDTRRDFVYVDDLVKVVIKAVDGVGHGTYHVSSGSDISIKEMFDATTTALDMGTIDVEVRPRLADDAPSILLEPGKTNETFEWQTQTSLVDGVRKAVEYYHKHGIKETFTHLHSVEE